jgi:hypothetical protein
LLLGAALLCLVGCNQLNPSTTKDPDPLLGATAAAAPPAAKADLKAGTPVVAVPPVPDASSVNSTVALTAAIPRKDGAADLRIRNGASNEGSENWARPGATSGEKSAAVLRGPETAVEPAAQRDGNPVYNTVSQGNARQGDFEQAQAQLAQRGVIWQALQAGERGEWKFTCSIPNPQNPKLRRTYEAQGADYLSAMRAVLEKIDKEQQR